MHRRAGVVLAGEMRLLLVDMEIDHAGCAVPIFATGVQSCQLGSRNILRRRQPQRFFAVRNAGTRTRYAVERVNSNNGLKFL